MMTLIPSNATARQWRIVQLSLLCAGCALVTAIATIVGAHVRSAPAPRIVSESMRMVMLASGVVIALCGGQLHLARRQLERTESERPRAWMTRLSVTLYAFGFACVGLGIAGLGR